MENLRLGKGLTGPWQQGPIKPKRGPGLGIDSRVVVGSWSGTHKLPTRAGFLQPWLIQSIPSYTIKNKLFFYALCEYNTYSLQMSIQYIEDFLDRHIRI